MLNNIVFVGIVFMLVGVTSFFYENHLGEIKYYSLGFGLVVFIASQIMRYIYKKKSRH